MTLRSYQLECVDALFAYFATHPTGNPLIALPPAAGKSHVIAAFIERALRLYPKTRFLSLVHVKELIEQNFSKLVNAWPTAPAGIFSAGLGRKETNFPITFAGIASLAKKTADFGHIDLVIADEADMVSHREGTMYRKVLDELRAVNPKLRVIGLTATPYRLGLGLLTDGGVFTDIVVDFCTFTRFNELLDAGFLCPIIPKHTDTAIDTSEVHISNGEFVQHELQAVADVDRITRAAVAEMVSLGRERRHWLTFCTGIKHAYNVTNALVSAHIEAGVVHSKMTEKDALDSLRKGETPRDVNIRLFRSGQLRCMVGVDVFGVGFDAPETDLIGMLKPTASTRKHVQYWGRGLRPHPSKVNCLGLDFARNTIRLGPINDPVLPQKPGSKKPSMVPFKICPECMTYNHTRSLLCIGCGFEFPVTFKGTQSASSRDLIRRDDTPPPPPKPKKETKVVPLDAVTYPISRLEFSRHEKNGNPSMHVTYWVGARTFSQFLAFESPKQFARHKAREVWRQLAATAPPDTVDDALTRVGELKTPSGIRVIMGGEWPEVVGYEFGPPALPVLEDDDIPF